MPAPDELIGEQGSARRAVRSFPPLEGKTAGVLILGTMPGRASLDAERYYAHARNAFWTILTSLLDCLESVKTPSCVAMPPPYAVRVTRLIQHDIALWDVLAECERPGSLDAAIRRDSEVANDLPSFCARHPELSLIAFNGKSAATLFARHAASIPRDYPQLEFTTLPSTSPAYAAMSLAEKQKRWEAGLRNFLRPA